MDKFGRSIVEGLGPLRAVLVFVFLLMSAVQPGLFAAANATGFHGSVGIAVGADAPFGSLDGHGDRHGAHASAEVGSEDTGAKAQYRGAKESLDKNCEVHCAPAHAVPVMCPGIDRIAVRCFAPLIAEALPFGEYPALIRPPRA